MRQERQLGSKVKDIEDVGVMVERVEAMGMDREQSTEVLLSSHEIFGVVCQKCVTCKEERGCWEDVKELLERIAQAGRMLVQL